MHDAIPARRVAPPRRPIDTHHWLAALDALTPYFIVAVALAVVRHHFPSPSVAVVTVIVATVVLAVGTAAMFVREMSVAHLTWPVGLMLLVVVFPLLGLHVQVESVALAAPVAVHLLPLTFTWMALLTATCLLIGAVLVLSSEDAGWAGTLIAPIALLFGVAPGIAARSSEQAFLTIVLLLLLLSELSVGIAWLLPQRGRRWVVPALLIVGGAMLARTFAGTSYQQPGRAMLIVDVGLVVVVGGVALLAAPLCRWLTGGRAPNHPKRHTPD
jgi:hypothetical protein